jgi:hypothetical protein
MADGLAFQNLDGVPGTAEAHSLEIAWASYHESCSYDTYKPMPSILTCADGHLMET